MLCREFNFACTCSYMLKQALPRFVIFARNNYIDPFLGLVKFCSWQYE